MKNKEPKVKKTKLRNLLGRCQAAAKIISLNLVTIFSGIVTIASLSITLIKVFTDEEATTFIIFTIISFFASLIALISTLIFKVIEQKQIIIHPYTNAELDYLYDELISKTKYKMLKKGKARLIYNESTNEFIEKEIMSIPFNKSGNLHYSLPKECSRNAWRVFSDYLNKEHRFFNSKKIRLNNSPEDVIEEIRTKKDSAFQISKTKYFNSICSNELAKQEMKYDSDIGYCFNGFNLVKTNGSINKPSRLVELKESQCSNHIGVSVLAITEDNHIILTKQGKRNLIDSNRYIVSASGSADWNDKKHCKSFGQIIVNAMNRELTEECNIKLDNIISTKVIGYARLLDRGGKPEFFGISHLNLNANKVITLAKKGKEVNKGLVTDFKAIDNIENLKEFVDDIEKKECPVTAQLYYYVKVLLETYSLFNKSLV